MFEKSDLSNFATLKSIIAKLRSADGGCPWDREQTHLTLRPYLIEESYEVLEALDEQDRQKLCTELGDLLLQIMLHAQIADEEDKFTIEDVITSISTKMIKRHPHVFGGINAASAQEVQHNWEKLKQDEKRSSESLLASAPKNMPALAYSQDIQQRAAAAGFDWEKTEDILDKLVEEVDELVRASNHEEKTAEFGDILFVLVNLARRLNIDSETALREANRRFYKRFEYMEKACRDKGITFANLSFAEQNTLWEEAKKDISRE